MPSLPSLLRRGSGADKYDPEQERAVSAEILEQARWMFQQDESRHENAQRMAATVLTLTGTAVALLANTLPTDPDLWELIGLGIILLAGLGTAWCCLLTLLPRSRENGLPSVRKLRQFANRHDRQRRLPIPASQFAVDLLNAKDLQADSPLDIARRQANKRMMWLGHAYVLFGITFGLIMSFVVAQAVW